MSTWTLGQPHEGCTCCCCELWCQYVRLSAMMQILIAHGKHDRVQQTLDELATRDPELHGLATRVGELVLAVHNEAHGGSR